MCACGDYHRTPLANAAAGEVEKSKMVTSHRRGDYPFLLWTTAELPPLTPSPIAPKSRLCAPLCADIKHGKRYRRWRPEANRARFC